MATYTHYTFKLVAQSDGTYDLVAPDGSTVTTGFTAPVSGDDPAIVQDCIADIGTTNVAGLIQFATSGGVEIEGF